jgi:NADH-quinone oxidoreductase subunit L
LEKWLEPVIEFGEADIHGTWAYDNKYLLLVFAVVTAALGIAGAVAVYSKKKVAAIEPAILEQAWNYDKGVSAFMGGPGRKGFDAVAWFDPTVVDGAVNGVAKTVQGAAGEARKSQSGYVRQYAASVGIGVVLMLVWFVVIRGIL